MTVDNLGGVAQTGLSVQSNVYDVAGTLLDSRSQSAVTVASGGVLRDVLHPTVPATTKPPTPAKTYFVELLLLRGGQVIDRNVYWLSTQRDLVNWSKTMGNPQATMTQYANLRGLRSLPSASISAVATTHPQAGPDGADTETDVTITNTSKTKAVAFFLRADVRRGNAAGTPLRGDNQVLPIFWSDNDVTLWPGESETLQADYRTADLRGASPVVSVAGWNVGTTVVPGK